MRTSATAYMSSAVKVSALAAKRVGRGVQTRKPVLQNPASLASRWYFVDASDKVWARTFLPGPLVRVHLLCLQVVGRLANAIVPVLLGKTKPIYDPSRDCGDFVVVTNCDKAVFTGSKEKEKEYVHHTGFPGGLKVRHVAALFSTRCRWASLDHLSAHPPLRCSPHPFGGSESEFPSACLKRFGSSESLTHLLLRRWS